MRAVEGSVTVYPSYSQDEHARYLGTTLKLHFLDSRLLSWDGYCGSVISSDGNRFKWILWRPEFPSRSFIKSEAVREHFRKLGFYGHAGLFMEWCGLNYDLDESHYPDYHLQEECYYASIPEDSHCFRLSDGGLLAPRLVYSPYEVKQDTRWCRAGSYIDRSLSLACIDCGGWSNRWSFLGFREI